MPPQENRYTNNYVGKTLNDIGLTQQLETTAAAGINTKTILGVGDKYQIDLYGSLQTHRPEETPLLTIMESIGSETANAPYFVWSDEYVGTSWWDISLDNLRQKNVVSALGGTKDVQLSGFGAKYDINSMPVAISENTYAGGILKIVPITSVDHATNNILAFTDNQSTNLDKVQDMTIPSNNFMYGQAMVPTNGIAGTVMFAIMQDNDNTVGQMDVTWNKIRNLLVNMGYQELGYDNTNDDNNYEKGTVLRYTPDSMLPVYMALPNISYYDGYTTGNHAHEEQILVRLRAVAYTTVGGKNVGKLGLVFAIDFTDSNSTMTAGNLTAYNSGSAYDSVMIGQPYPKGTPANVYAVFGATQSDAAKYAGSISRMLFIGQAQNAAQPIPEGDKFTAMGNFTMGREQKMNLTQIFVSPAYGITGTHQASSFRFGDDFAKTRDMYFSIYKKRMQGTFMYGVKGETVANAVSGNYGAFVTGQPMRATGGLMDYAMFPIRHIKAPLQGVAWNNSAADRLIDWLDKLAENLAAFRQQGTKSLTFLCSQNFVNRLNRLVRGTTSNSLIMGGAVQLQAPSQLSFGLQYYEFVASSGVLVKFIHDPGMDNTPSIKVPYWIYGQQALSPRDLLISIDPQNMKRVVLRPDKIHGNVQDIGQDAFMEAIRGESGFKLRFPQNHAIVWAPDEA